MKKNNKKGFTLVELVIVVAVMAILVAVAIPTISSVKSSAETSVQASNAQTVESMVKLYEAEKQVNATAAGTLTAYLEKAALGIDDATFTYNASNGKCEYVGKASATATAPTKGYVIVFAASTGAPTATPCGS